MRRAVVIVALTLMGFILGCAPSIPSCSTGTGLPEFSEVSLTAEPSFVAPLRKKTVHIFAEYTGQPGYSTGSGVVVGEGGTWVSIMTAWHVIWDRAPERKSRMKLPENILVSTLPENEPSWVLATEAQLGCFDAQHDLAILLLPKFLVEKRLKIPEPYKMMARADDPNPGETLWIVSNSAHYEQIVSRGVVGTFIKEDNDGALMPYQMATDAFGWRGGSGSGAYDDQGRLVGIVSRAHFRHRITYLVPPSIIKSFVLRCEAEAKARMEAGAKGFEAIEVTEFKSPDHFILGSPQSIDPTWVDPDKEEDGEEDLE